MLPAEIYQYIFTFIPDVNDLKNIALVSKQFHELIKEFLWKSPSLKYGISHSELSKLSHLPIKELDLVHLSTENTQCKCTGYCKDNYVNEVTNDWLMTIVTNWKNLTSLYLKY